MTEPQAGQQQQSAAGGTPGAEQSQQQQGAPGAGQQQAQPPATPASWDEVVATLTPEVKTLYEGHTAGLKSALQTERQQRSELAKQINTLSKQAADGSDLKKSLEGMTAKLESETQRADFYEQAVKPEIGCSNPGLAFIAARESGAIDQRGRINWGELKQQFPELFKSKSPPPASAGAGTSNPPAAKADMSAWIRHAAGRM
jgi:hypothetical protein